MTKVSAVVRLETPRIGNVSVQATDIVVGSTFTPIGI